MNAQGTIILSWLPFSFHGILRKGWLHSKVYENYNDSFTPAAEEFLHCHNVDWYGHISGTWSVFPQWPSTFFYVVLLKSSNPPMNSAIVRNKHPTCESKDMYDPYSKYMGVISGTAETSNCKSDLVLYAEWCLHVHRQNLRDITFLELVKHKNDRCLCLVSAQLDWNIGLISTFWFPEKFRKWI